MSETFGERLSRLRRAKQIKRRGDAWSQEGLAQQLSVTPQTICNWEHNWKDPSRERIAQLARLFGVSEHYLLHGHEDPRLVQLAEALNATTRREAELQAAVQDYLHSSIDTHHAAYERLVALVSAP